jgi:hypothetical protein
MEILSERFDEVAEFHAGLASFQMTLSKSSHFADLSAASSTANTICFSVPRLSTLSKERRFKLRKTGGKVSGPTTFRAASSREKAASRGLHVRQELFQQPRGLGSDLVSKRAVQSSAKPRYIPLRRGSLRLSIWLTKPAHHQKNPQRYSYVANPPPDTRNKTRQTVYRHDIGRTTTSDSMAVHTDKFRLPDTHHSSLHHTTLF